MSECLQFQSGSPNERRMMGVSSLPGFLIRPIPRPPAQEDGALLGSRKGSIPLQVHVLPVLRDSPLCGPEAGTLSLPLHSNLGPSFSLNDTLAATCPNVRGHSRPLGTKLQGLRNFVQVGG